MDGATLPGRDGNGVPYSGNGRLPITGFTGLSGTGHGVSRYLGRIYG